MAAEDEDEAFVRRPVRVKTTAAMPKEGEQSKADTQEEADAEEWAHRILNGIGGTVEYLRGMSVTTAAAPPAAAAADAGQRRGQGQQHVRRREEKEEEMVDSVDDNTDSNKKPKAQEQLLLLRELIRQVEDEGSLGTTAALRPWSTMTTTSTTKDRAAIDGGREIDEGGDDDIDDHGDVLPPDPIVVVDRVMIPLVEALAACYEALDETLSPSSSTATTTNKGGLARRNGSNCKPNAPRGLLSLHQYADVAALIECLVVMAIVVPTAVYLEDDNDEFHEDTKDQHHHRQSLDQVLQARARNVSKSIAGRMPPSCIVHWGRQMVKSLSHHQQDQMSTLHRVQRAVTAVGKLLLLDRFRPMLLPRHLSDLYLGIFCVNQCGSRRRLHDKPTRYSDNREEETYKRVASLLLPPNWEEINGDDEDKHVSELPARRALCRVDAAWQARACQSLLANAAAGKTSAQNGLRSEVAVVLSRIAASDLAALIQVFVPSGDTGACALRLARAVVLAPPSQGSATTTTKMTPSHRTYLFKVGAQVSILLDGAARRLQEQHQQGLEAGVLSTLWAILDGMPVELVHEQLGGGGVDPTRLVGRWQVLLSLVPPFVPARKVLQLLLRVDVDKNQHVGATSAFMVLVRRALSSSVLHDPSRDAARDALQHIIQWSADRDAAPKLDGAKATQVVAVAMLHAIVHDVAASHDVTMNEASMDSYVSCLEMRFKALANNVLVPHVPTAREDQVQSDVDASTNKIMSFMFLVLLSMYLEGNPTGAFADHDARSADIDIATTQYLRLIPFVALPILCEECSMESLLHSSTQIFQLMSVTFGQAACLLQPGAENHTEPRREDVGDCQMTLDQYGTLSGCPIFQSMRSTTVESMKATASSADTVLSLCSLLLGVLIGILELGATKRLDSDEALLQSFPAQLLPLAGMHVGRTADDSDASDELSADVPAELVSMAGHAIALILASQAPMAPAANAPLSTPDRIDRLKVDLNADEVPIRASAVVSLRRLACDLLSHAAPGMDAFRVLSLILEALKDTDSYVYLAAIQTIAFLADFKPDVILPVIGRAVATGELEFDAASTVKLSSEQRVKLAEALVSCIRRKVAVHEYLTMLLDALVFGGTEDDSPRKSSSESDVLIQQATHAYFSKGFASQSDEANETDVTSDVDRWEETDIRVRTGGPLFEEEHDEVVRAAKLSVVTELVMSSHPASLSRYCPVLVQCAIGCLQQGRSRPIRRAGALLARELYSTAIREHDPSQPRLTNRNSSYGIPFSVALVGPGKERSLAAALERCVNHEDRNDLGIDLPRLLDPATIARCQEALNARAEAEEIGIMAAARCLAEAEAATRSQPMLRMLLEPSRIGDPATSTSISRMIEEM